MKLPVFPVEGGCQCRAARYQVTAPPLTVYACWCRDCQRASGTTHTMSMFVRREDVALVAGTLTAYEKAADSGRTVRMMACASCGTRLWNEPLSSPEILVIKPGTLDEMGWAKPVGNIWTDSAPAFAQIDPALVNFPGQPASRQPLFDAWQRAVAAG
ncbi:MAG: GFA family protein [Rhizobiales bacterium]|nr:GFA family protein [Hyphomicrobiales bacterium]